MDVKTISHGCVAAFIHKGEKISGLEAEAAVNSALLACGYEPWARMDIELFEGKNSGLLLAHDAGGGLSVHFAPELLRIFQKYFTE